MEQAGLSMTSTVSTPGPQCTSHKGTPQQIFHQIHVDLQLLTSGPLREWWHTPSHCKPKENSWKNNLLQIPKFSLFLVDIVEIRAVFVQLSTVKKSLRFGMSSVVPHQPTHHFIIIYGLNGNVLDGHLKNRNNSVCTKPTTISPIVL